MWYCKYIHANKGIDGIIIDKTICSNLVVVEEGILITNLPIITRYDNEIYFDAFSFQSLLTRYLVSIFCCSFTRKDKHLHSLAFQKNIPRRRRGEYQV